MASTRVKASNQATIYHRIAELGDQPQTDVGTTETLATKVGSSGDFQLLADSTIVMTEQNQEITGVEQLATVASPKLIWIKHSGFTSSAKTVANIADTLLVGITDGTAVAEGFTSLSADQSILLTAPFGSGVTNLNDIQLKASANTIFAEIIIAVD